MARAYRSPVFPIPLIERRLAIIKPHVAYPHPLVVFLEKEHFFCAHPLRIPPIRRQTPSRETVGWDNPLSDKGAWIVPAESEAQAPFVWMNWYRKHIDSSAPSLPKQLRTLLSLRGFLIDCY
jgi:hypothetical protein